MATQQPQGVLELHSRQPAVFATNPGHAVSAALASDSNSNSNCNVNAAVFSSEDLRPADRLPATAPSPSPALRLQTSNLTPRRKVSTTTLSGLAPHSSQGMARSSSSYLDNLSPASATTASASTNQSPALEPFRKITPLPSPLVSTDSPGPWKMWDKPISRNTSLSKGSMRGHRRGESVFITASGETLDAALGAQSQRKQYQGLTSTYSTQPHYPGNNTLHYTERSSSGDSSTLAVPSTPIRGSRDVSRQKSSDGSISGDERSPTGFEFDLDSGARMRREKCLAQRRRTISSTESSPWLSGSATSLSSFSSVETTTEPDSSTRLIKKQRLESFEAKMVKDGSIRKWRGIKLIGQGAFSKVILATSEDIPDVVDHVKEEGALVVEQEHVPLNPRKFVAVKVVEHGAAGGASKERVESGLKRELDILKTVHHPCLVHLKAYHIEPSRALLVLQYCAGGDLFDVASDPDLNLTAPIIRRMFAEIVSALRYLHQNGIVHRDVKLENVLVNFTRPHLAEFAANPDFSYPHPLTTLTDVGLSRRVDFEHDELLTTRCGSDDYASPELIMGQPYDGRKTDAWALGVLLYALMEGRLPFDPPPGGPEQKMRSKTAHRIARCEWKWYRLAEPSEGVENDADIDLESFKGGKEIVEGLVKRALKRWTLDMVEQHDWLKGTILTTPLTHFAE